MAKVEKSPDILGKRIDEFQLRPGLDVLICSRFDPRKRCYAGTVTGILEREWRRYVLLQHVDEEGRIEYLPVGFSLSWDGNKRVPDWTQEVYLRKYGSSIANVVEKGKLPAGVDQTLAEMLTGRRPPTPLPAKPSVLRQADEKSGLPSDTSQMYKVGGRTRKAKGRRYRKRAGRLSTRRVR